MSLQIGDAAPDFTLPDQNGDPISLASLRGTKVVLYFYPKDDTPGCTKEACNFRDRWEQLKANNITCLLYTSPSPRDRTRSRMPSSA